MTTARRGDDLDILGVFFIGAAVATGNPAVAELGIKGVLLPVFLALLALLVTRSRSLPFLTGIRWIGACYIAFIFLWYEQYKLTGDEGSVQLFITLTDWLGVRGHEGLMRIGVGLCEIIASAFILVPGVQGLGAIGAFVLMTGAIFFHLVTPLGVDPYNDGGVLFKQACSVWISSVVIIWWQRHQLSSIARRFGVPVSA